MKLGIVAPVFEAWGYSTIARNLIYSLLELGIDFKVYPVSYWKGNQKLESQLEFLLGDKVVPTLAELENRVIVNVTTPDKFLFLEDHVHIGYTTAESIKVASHFVPKCNRSAAIFVPTQWSYTALEASGVSKEKLYKVPLGIDLKKFHSSVQSISIDTKSFVFLSVFNWIRRKGWNLLLDAYLSSFTSKDDVTLLICSRRPNEKEIDRQQIISTVSSCKQRYPNPPHIHMLSSFLPEEEIPGLYTKGNVFVLPSRGEGLGLPFLEAGAVGIPSIATNWSAQTEYLTKDNSYLVETEGQASDELLAREMPIYKGLPFAKPNLSSLREQMLKSLTDKERVEKGNKMREVVQKDWDIRKNVPLFLERVESITKKSSKRPVRKKVLLATAHIFDTDDLDITSLIADLKSEYDVTCFYVYDKDHTQFQPKRFTEDGVAYIQLPTNEGRIIDIATVIDEVGKISTPDLVISCTRIGTVMIEVAEYLKVPHIYLANNYLFLLDVKAINNNFEDLVNCKFDTGKARQYGNLLAKSKVICVSQFMQDFVKKVYDQDSYLWYPGNRKVDNDGGNKVGLLGSLYESSALPLNIASLVSHETFVVSGSNLATSSLQNNVQILENPEAFCSSVRRILCVSRFPIAYSRILHCAALSKIPIETFILQGFLSELLDESSIVSSASFNFEYKISENHVDQVYERAIQRFKNESFTTVIRQVLKSYKLESSVDTTKVLRDQTLVSMPEILVEDKVDIQKGILPTGEKTSVSTKSSLPENVLVPQVREVRAGLEIGLKNLNIVSNWLDILSPLKKICRVRVGEEGADYTFDCQQETVTDTISVSTIRDKDFDEKYDSQSVVIIHPYCSNKEASAVVTALQGITTKYTNVHLVGIGYDSDPKLYSRYIQVSAVEHLNTLIMRSAVVIDTSCSIFLQKRCQRFKVLYIGVGKGNVSNTKIFTQSTADLSRIVEKVLLEVYEEDFSETSINTDIESEARRILPILYRKKLSSISSKITKKKIGLVKVDGLGGTIALTDQVEKVKALVGDEYSVIPIVRSNAEVFRGNPFVDTTITAGNLRWGSEWEELVKNVSKDFDCVADIRICVARWVKSSYSFESYRDEVLDCAYERFPLALNSLGRVYKLHKVQLVDKCLGLPCRTIDTRLYLTSKDFEVADQLREPYIVIAPGTDPIHGNIKQTKSWNSWEELVQMIKENGFPYITVQVGLLGDPLIKGTVDLRGGTSLRELFGVLSKSKKIVTCENGIMHAAYALRHPDTTVLRGPTEEYLFVYPGQKDIHSGICEPCWWQSVDWYTKCRQNTDATCMKHIASKKVYETIKEETGPQYRYIVVDLLSANSKRGLGDTILTTVAIRALKEKHQLPITCIVREQAISIFDNNPNVDQVYSNLESADVYNEKCLYLPVYMLLEDYRVKRNCQNRIDSILELFNIETNNKVPELFLTEEEKKWGQSKMQAGKINVGICIESVTSTRSWSVSNLKELIVMMGGDFHFHILGSNSEEIKISNVTTYKTTLKELFSLVSAVDLVLTMDTLVSHVAGALQKPAVVLYTTISADWRCSYYKNCVGLQSPVKCSPCMDRQSNVPTSCSQSKVPPCISALTPKYVYEKVIEFINKWKKK